MKTAGIILCIALCVLLLILVLASGLVFNLVIWRKTVRLPKFIEKMIAGNEENDPVYEVDLQTAKAEFCALPREDVWLTAPDGARLLGRVLVPEHPNGRTMLLCHGARSSGIGEYRFMAPYLYKNGYTLVIPDHRGCGESDGKYMGYGTHESKDTFLWLRYAKERFPENSIFLLGISMGAATVLMMSNHLEDAAVKGVIADCPYTSAWDEFSYQIHTSFRLPDFPILHICDLYCRALCGYAFKAASPLDAVKCAKKPILFIHGAADDFVPIFMQDILFDACPTAKEKLTVEGAVHARSYYTNPELYNKTLLRFMDTYDEEHK